MVEIHRPTQLRDLVPLLCRGSLIARGLRDEAGLIEKLVTLKHFFFVETQAIAKLYDAACTPDFYVFDAWMRLVYRGRIDGSRPKNDLLSTGEDLRAALDAVLEGAPNIEKQYPSGGCNIKWKP